jgi:hypothetical protein
VQLAQLEQQVQSAQLGQQAHKVQMETRHRFSNTKRMRRNTAARQKTVISTGTTLHRLQQRKSFLAISLQTTLTLTYF